MLGLIWKTIPESVAKCCRIIYTMAASQGDAPPEWLMHCHNGLRTVCALQQASRVLPTWVAGPKRKNLRVRNPEKYHWKPAELLKQLARVYLNLSRADRAGDFVAAIAADQRSYHEGIFVEAAEVRGVDSAAVRVLRSSSSSMVLRRGLFCMQRRRRSAQKTYACFCTYVIVMLASRCNCSSELLLPHCLHVESSQQLTSAQSEASGQSTLASWSTCRV